MLENQLVLSWTNSKHRIEST